MVVLKVESEWGQSPDKSPYSLISNLRTWKILQDVKQGDLSGLAKTVNVYPRFMPSPVFVRPFGLAVLKKLGFESKAIMIYLNPELWEFSRRHVSDEERGPLVMNPDDLIFKCVDVAGHRLYLVIYDVKQSPSLMGTWTRTGAGISLRAAEMFLAQIDTLVEVPVTDSKNPPAPTWTPEEPVHQALRERINELLHHGAIDPAKVTSRPEDVFLYPTGLNGFYMIAETFFRCRPGHAIIYGMPYHTTYEYLKGSFYGKYKHFGMANEQSMEEMETWIESEARAGNPVSFVLTETPCNPTLAMPDIARLKRLSEKYGFVLIVDDTVSGFANIDVLPLADVLYTSITKSFSGKADCIGGSIVLNPQSPHYSILSSHLSQSYHNELFAADAQVLLSNSADYFPRMQIYNRNAQLIADYLQQHVQDPNSPVTKVRYPSLLPAPEKHLYDQLMRRSTPDFPVPGYGCLGLVEFEDTATAIAFYDRCGFLSTPHFGAPLTLVFAANTFLYRRNEEEAQFADKYDVPETGIRLAAGLEDEQDVIDTLKDALDAAIEVKKSQAQAHADK